MDDHIFFTGQVINSWGFNGFTNLLWFHVVLIEMIMGQSWDIDRYTIIPSGSDSESLLLNIAIKIVSFTVPIETCDFP